MSSEIEYGIKIKKTDGSWETLWFIDLRNRDMRYSAFRRSLAYRDVKKVERKAKDKKKKKKKK